MKASLMAIALMLPVGFALAQKEPGNESSKSGSNTATQSSPSTKTAKTDEVRTKTYKGTLVDAGCAGGPGSTASTTSTSQSASTAKTGEASRATGSGQSCDATTNTSAFGIRMRDGSVMRFDAVGNERTKEAIAAKKKWSDEAAGGKPIQASVSGTESGDTLTVVSIH